MSKTSKDFVSKHLTLWLIQEELQYFEERLCNRETRVSYSSDHRPWAKWDWPGVYAVWDGDELLYVGEAGNCRSRLSQLLMSRDHPLILEVARRGMTPKMCSFNMAYIRFGRKEVEDHMIAKYQPCCNTQGK